MSSSPAAPDWLWVAEGSVWLVIAAVPSFFSFFCCGQFVDVVVMVG